MTDRERRARAHEEAFFDLLDGQARIHILAFLDPIRKKPENELSDAARKFLQDRGIL